MNTQHVQKELVKLDLATTIEKLDKYATYRLKNVDTKQLEGLTSQDFVQQMFLKVLEGTRSWENAKTDDIETFLFMCLKSDISHFLEKISRRGANIMSLEDERLDDNTKNYNDEDRG